MAISGNIIESMIDTSKIQRFVGRRRVAFIASVEKAGFELEARLKDAVYKNGAYMDELIFAIRR
jgi:RimJ/RimL family protein N-acetyltransferase